MKVRTFVCNMLHENCYVIYDEESREAAVIDPRMYWDEEKRLFSKFIEENDLHVKYLLCTHLHFDHIFGTTFGEDTYGLRLSASLEDSPWITNFMQSDFVYPKIQLSSFKSQLSTPQKTSSSHSRGVAAAVICTNERAAMRNSPR